MNLNLTATWGTRGPLTISERDGLAIALAYCFGRTVDGRRLYAYASFDAALRGGPDSIESAIHAANGLNARLAAADLLTLLRLHELSALPDLRNSPPFWMMPYNDVGTRPRSNTSPSFGIWEWYDAITNIDGLGGAASSKTGHHLAPTVMPLWDNLVGKSWSLDHMWSELHQQLNQQTQWCLDLERGVEYFRIHHEAGFGIPVTRLRIVDIVLWLMNRGELAFALSIGQTMLQGLNPAIW